MGDHSRCVELRARAVGGRTSTDAGRVDGTCDTAAAVTDMSNETPPLGGPSEGTTLTKTKREPSGAALGVGAVFAMVLCCAGPLLLAGGAIGAIGGFLTSPVVIVLGVVLIVCALVAATRRTRTEEDCCAPQVARTSTDEALDRLDR